MTNSEAITILRRERDGWIKDGLGSKEEVAAFDLAIALMEQQGLEAKQEDLVENARARFNRGFVPSDFVCKPEPDILRPTPSTAWQLLADGTIHEIRWFDPTQLLAYAGTIYATREAAEKARAEQEKARHAAAPEPQSLLNPPWLVATRVLAAEVRRLKKQVKKLKKQLDAASKQTAQKLSALEARIATQQSAIEDFIASDKYDWSNRAPDAPHPWKILKDTTPWLGPTCKQ